jgi:hypothetical protein
LVIALLRLGLGKAFQGMPINIEYRQCNANLLMMRGKFENIGELPDRRRHQHIAKALWMITRTLVIRAVW